MKNFLALAAVAIGTAALSPAAISQMCGDCNHDGRVTINELVSAVNNALSPDIDAFCGLGCAGNDTICPNECVEFPGNYQIQCFTDFCHRDEKQFTLCLEHYYATTNLCTKAVNQ